MWLSIIFQFKNVSLSKSCFFNESITLIFDTVVPTAKGLNLISLSLEQGIPARALPASLRNPLDTLMAFLTDKTHGKEFHRPAGATST
jgi:hypothetical protein